jgi:N-formylglutamate amidohydrolase
MYDRKLSVAEIRRRIETYYKPYHAALAQTLDDKRRRFGRVWHVNCHSMVSVSSVKGPEGRAGMERPHFILGDVDGSTCAPEFTDLVRANLAGMGYEVRINTPYTAAELVIAYADPANGCHGLMIDIKRDLYMDEETIERTSGFTALEADVTRLIEAICDYARSAA